MERILDNKEIVADLILEVFQENSTLKKQLKESEETSNNRYNWWQREESKVRKVREIIKGYDETMSFDALQTLTKNIKEVVG